MLLKKIILSAFLTAAISLCPGLSLAEVPTVTYNSGKFQLKSPDWSRISWSNLDAVQEGGFINVSSDIVRQLGYNPSRSWNAGQTIDSIIMLGDVDEAFEQSKFTLNRISAITNISTKELTLDKFGLMKWQDLGSLSRAVPNLRNVNISRIKPVQDLLQRNGINAGGTLGQVLSSYNEASNLSLGDLDLSKYSINSIPRLGETQIGRFQNWQQTLIKEIPGLNKVPFDKMPIPIDSGLNVVGIASVVLGESERGDSRARDNYFVSGKINRSNETVIVPCEVGKECSYLELGDVAGSQGLYGKRWASGSSQQVDGGFGILQAVNGGKEPTGRLVYGPAFKVVLTGVNEATGTANFGIFFRVCIRFFWGGRSCTPYFIGPVPWIPVKENNLVILGGN
ncbi:hypothetical protein [Anabaena azotica]|nr:hypothetical protein [Anabaena azotica]